MALDHIWAVSRFDNGELMGTFDDFSDALAWCHESGYEAHYVREVRDQSDDEARRVATALAAEETARSAVRRANEWNRG